MMKNKLLYSFLCLMILYQTSGISLALAQERTVSGKVTSLEDGEGLPGVNVVEKGTTNGTVSDIEGRYSIDVKAGATLVFSSVGFTSEEVEVGNKSVIDLVMNQDIQQLQELVVVGFGTQKKENLTGAVGTVDTEVLESRPVNRVGQALQGLIPGLNITQSNGGNMGNEPEFNIRGVTTIGAGSSGQPLILIDGMEADINTINPQDIENISVLKDAAASSIYGSRAPFGVILITTKNGKAGKPTISYTNNFRWNSPILMPEMMDSYTFALYVNDGSVNSGQGIRYPDEALQRILDYQAGLLDGPLIPNPNNPQFWGVDFQPHGNNDWYEITYRDYAPSMDHTLSFSGGNESTTYFISANFLDQDGLMKLSYDTYQRYNLTTKISTKLADWANITYTGRWGRQNADQPSWVEKAFNFHQRQGNRGWPTMPLYDNNGFLYQQFGQFDYAVGMATGGRSKEQNDWMYHQMQVRLEPAKDLTVFGNLNYRTENDYNVWNQNVLYNHDVNGNPVVILPQSGLEEFNSGSNFFNPNIYAEYQKTINNHYFKVMSGFQYEEFNIRRNRVWRDGLISADFPVLDLTSGADINGNPLVPSVSGSRDHWSTAGFFGRINYDFEGRYLMELNLRYDGTSRFREDQRWNLFPSVSAGWNIANESFWQNLSNVVNDFKLRASYGILGNQNTTSLYPTYVTIPIGIANGNWLVNGIRPNTSRAPGLISSTLGWEQIKSYNIGVDLGLFENRLTSSFDYFVRYTNDMVGPAPELPDILGTAVPRTNNTDLKTYGFELSLAWRDRLKNGLGYNVNLLLSDSKTEILSYPNPTRNLNQFREGQMVGEIWGYTTKGIAKSQEEMDAHLSSLPEGGQNAVGNNWLVGDIMYTDINGDGKIDNGSNTEDNPGDLSIIGNTTPRYSFGLDLGADWKGFDFRAFFQGVLERDFYQNSNYFFGTFNSVWNTVGLVNHTDYFRNDPNHPLGLNLDSYFHRPVYGGKNRRTQTRYLQDASYVRLKNLQLGYTLPRALTEKVSVEKLRLYVSGENLLTFTNLIDIFDPETIDGGFGGNVYPLSRIYSVGMMLNF